MIQIVGFDWNNTLLDDLVQAHQAMRTIFKYWRKPYPSIEAYVRAASNTGNWNSIFDLHGITMPVEELRPMYIARYLELAHEIELAAHARTSLEQIRHAGIEVHIITAARQELAEPLMQATGILNLCDELHYFEKNKGACVRGIIEHRGIKPHEFALVGDMRSDVEDGLRAGVHAIAVQSPHVPRDLFADMGCMHFYALTLQGVVDYVLSI